MSREVESVIRSRQSCGTSPFDINSRQYTSHLSYGFLTDMANNGYDRKKSLIRLLNPLPRQLPRLRGVLSPLYDTYDSDLGYPFTPAMRQPFDTNRFRDDNRDEYIAIRGSDYAELLSHYRESLPTPAMVAEDLERYIRLAEERVVEARKHDLNVALRHSDC
jgi:hypothetical protein